MTKIEREMLDKWIEMLDRIRKCAADFEAAHSLEDDLREQVLIAIGQSRSFNFCQSAAAIALKTSEIDFPRHCA